MLRGLHLDDQKKSFRMISKKPLFVFGSMVCTGPKFTHRPLVTATFYIRPTFSNILVVYKKRHSIVIYPWFAANIKEKRNIYM